MNSFEKLKNVVKKNNSNLCAGMDPTGIADKDLEDWCNIVVDTLKSEVACFKPNESFYSYDKGKEILSFLIKINPNNIFVIDGKFGDIGNTQGERARDIRDFYNNPDFVTISPYMGDPTWKEFNNVGISTFVVDKSSNSEGVALQERSYGGLSNSEFVATQLTSSSNMNGLVIGAGGDLEAVKRIRALSPEAYWLMPGGIGPQAKPESLNTLQYANDRAIINASRGLTGVPEYMDFRSPAYKELLLERAKEFNKIINDNLGQTKVTWKDVAVQNLLDSGIFKLSGGKDFVYKNGGEYTTYFQGRHLCGQNERTINSAVHLVASTAMSTWSDWKPDFVSPVLMGAIGLNKVAEAYGVPTLYVRPPKEGAGNNEAILGIHDYSKVEKVNVLCVEDIFSSGKSAWESADELKSILADNGVESDIRIIALGTNNSTAIDNVIKAGYKATACLYASEMVGLTLKQNPKRYTRPQISIINQDMINRFGVDVVKQYNI